MLQERDHGQQDGRGRWVDCRSGHSMGTVVDPVQVVSNGTPAYSGTIKEVMDSIPWQDIAATYLKKLDRTDSVRGNLQVNFGYSGAQNWENCRKTGKEIISKHYGVPFPVVDEGTADSLPKGAFSATTMLMRAMGVPFASPDYDDENDFAGMRSLLTESLGKTPGNVVQALTFAFNYLDDPHASIARHVDDKNCSVYSEVVTATKTIPHQGRPL